MANKSILFADDSITMRTIMENTFAAEPYDVTAVPSGEAAIMKARELVPDIIIADAGMAGVSGYDVCKAVREDSLIAGIPFIIMAGVSSPYDESRGAEAGVTEYVKKPFDTTQLIEKVGELAAGATAPTPAPSPVEAYPEPKLAPSPVSPDLPTAPPPPPLSGMPLTEKPVVAPPGPKPIASPMAQTPSKDTMEFGRPSETPEPAAFEPPQAEGTEAQTLEPEPEPIELDQPIKSGGEDSFRVSTLAEMAQMNEKGEVIDNETPDDAIELTTPAASAGPSSSIEEVVKDRARIAAEEIESQVDGLSGDQLNAIQALTADVVERVVWEIVPDLAETIIKEELARLLKE